MTDSKFVYAFADGFAEGSAEMTELLGGKGANLAEMCRMGLRTGFTLTSNVCTFYNSNDGAFPKGLKAEVDAAMRRLSEDMGLALGIRKPVACLGALGRACLHAGHDGYGAQSWPQ